MEYGIWEIGKLRLKTTGYRLQGDRDEMTIKMKIRIKKDCRLQAGGKGGAGACHKSAGTLTWG